MIKLYQKKTATNFILVQVLVISEKVTRIAAGSYHSVALTVSGKMYTWGYNGKYQLGRQGPALDSAMAKVEVELWYAFPGAIPGLGSAHGKTVRTVKTVRVYSG